MRTRHVLAATAALALVGSTAGAALTGASAAPADHKAKPTVGVVAKKLVGPLSVAQAPDGTRYWTDSFAGLLYKQVPAAQPSVIFADAKQGTAPRVSRPTAACFASPPGSGNNKSGKVWTLDAAGSASPARRHLRRTRSRRTLTASSSTASSRRRKSCLAQAPEAGPGVVLRPQGDPPLRRGHRRQRRHLRRRRRRQRDRRDLAHGRRSPRSPALKPVKVTVTKAAPRRRTTLPALRGRQEATPSRRCRPTSRSAADGTLYVTSLPGGPEDPSARRQRAGAPDRPGHRARSPRSSRG